MVDMARSGHHAGVTPASRGQHHEDHPVAFAKRILPYLVHVHLKDYRMVATPSGYRLFHCPIGAGLVDFPALFRLFQQKPSVLTHTAGYGQRWHPRWHADKWYANKKSM